MPLKKIVGDYSPGYIYGNVKTHNEGEKLRPIISQISAPTYNFTIERSVKKKASILKRTCEKTDDTVKSSVFRKPTDVGQCLSECSGRYKVSVVNLFRAKKISSERSAFLLELDRSKKLLVNCGHSNRTVDTKIKKFLR